MTDSLFLCYNYIMKNVKSKNILKKVRARNGTEIFYTYSHWPLEEIDGEKFIPVVREVPDSKKNQVVHYMKKDSMEYLK